MLRWLLRLVLLLIVVGLALAACGDDGTVGVKADDVETAERLTRLAEVGYVPRFSYFEDVMDRTEFHKFVCTPQAVWDASDGSEEFEVDDSNAWGFGDIRSDMPWRPSW